MKKARQESNIVGVFIIEKSVFGRAGGSLGSVCCDGDGDGDDDGTGAGVATGRQHKQETIRRGSIIKPTIRIVHGKPTLECVSSSLITIGHTTPPREEPPRTKPMAAPRLTLICWPTRASIGQARSAMDMPSRTPCARINW